MHVTDVRVRRIAREGKMRAVVSITIDNVFVVHDIKVIEGEKGLFIAMPSKKSADGEYRDIAHPINSETRSMLEEIILKSYEESALQEEGRRAVRSRKPSQWLLPLICAASRQECRILHRFRLRENASGACRTCAAALVSGMI